MMPQQIKELNLLLNKLSQERGVTPRDKQFIDAVKHICKKQLSEKERI